MSDLRMPELNHVFLAGRLTRDPELRYTPNGTAVCKLGIAVSRYLKTKEGERKEETLYINVTVWDKHAEYCGQNLRKGRPVLVEGSLKGEEWEDKTTGQRRTTISVRATRVQQLDWAERDATEETRADVPKPAEEPPPEDDVPF
jgi:single-strand DNA-binding protein